MMQTLPTDDDHAPGCYCEECQDHREQKADEEVSIWEYWQERSELFDND